MENYEEVNTRSWKLKVRFSREKHTQSLKMPWKSKFTLKQVFIDEENYQKRAEQVRTQILYLKISFTDLLNRAL